MVEKCERALADTSQRALLSPDENDTPEFEEDIKEERKCNEALQRYSVGGPW